MKLKGWIYRAATQVNVLSPENFNIVEADVVVSAEGRIKYFAHGEKYQRYRGLRQWHGIRWNVCELGRPIRFSLKEYDETSWNEQELSEGLMGVGWHHSTPRVGKPSTWGRMPLCCDASIDAIANTQRLGNRYA